MNKIRNTSRRFSNAAQLLFASFCAVFLGFSFSLSLIGPLNAAEINTSSVVVSSPLKNVKIEGIDVLNKTSLHLETPFADEKILVLFFLSAKCPCSDSHIPEIRRLSEKYKNVRFLAIHSNADEGAALTESYFKSKNLPFAVLQDTNLKMADQFKAYKTPHSFVLSAQGETLYQGGVTSSSKADEADEMYLDEVLEDITAGKKPRRTEGRTLGCVMMRESV